MDGALGTPASVTLGSAFHLPRRNSPARGVTAPEKGTAASNKRLSEITAEPLQRGDGVVYLPAICAAPWPAGSSLLPGSRLSPALLQGEKVCQRPPTRLVNNPSPGHRAPVSNHGLRDSFHLAAAPGPAGPSPTARVPRAGGNRCVPGSRHTSARSHARGLPESALRTPVTLPGQSWREPGAPCLPPAPSEPIIASHLPVHNYVLIQTTSLAGIPHGQLQL